MSQLRQTARQQGLHVDMFAGLEPVRSFLDRARMELGMPRTESIEQVGWRLEQSARARRQPEEDQG